MDVAQEARCEAAVLEQLGAARGLPIFLHVRGTQTSKKHPFAACVAAWADRAQLEPKRAVVALQQTERRIAGRLAEGAFGAFEDPADWSEDQQRQADGAAVACVHDMLEAVAHSDVVGKPFAVLAPPRLCAVGQHLSRSRDMPFVNTSTALRYDVAMVLFQGLAVHPPFVLVDHLVRRLFPSIAPHDPVSFLAGLELLLSGDEHEVGLVAPPCIVQIRSGMRENPGDFDLLKRVLECLCIGIGTQPILAQAARIYGALQDLRTHSHWPAGEINAEYAHMCIWLQQRCADIMDACMDEETSGPYYFAVLDLILSPGNGDLVLSKFLVDNAPFVLDLEAVSRRFADGYAGVRGRLGSDVDPSRLKTSLYKFLFEHKSNVDFWSSKEAHSPEFSCLRSVMGVVAALSTAAPPSLGEQGQDIYQACLGHGD